VTSALALIILLSLLIVGLVIQRRRRRAEGALRISYEQVRRLNGQLITAQEEERTRIARELHDDVGQRIASLSIGLSGLKRRTKFDTPINTELTELQRSALDLVKDLRELSLLGLWPFYSAFL
jgi:two-component system sensor histidine kinase UhpB